MKREDYTRIDNKLDKHTELLLGIQNDIGKEISLIKLAHQKLKYIVMSSGAITIAILAAEYPKLLKFVKDLI